MIKLKYSKAAAARILALKPKQIKEIRVDDAVYGPKVVWVQVAGQSPRLMSRRTFDEHFHQWRWEQGKHLHVHPNGPNRWVVINLNNKLSTYLVETRQDGIFCTCEDFHAQMDAFGQGRCKHACAILQYLGHTSLNAYLKAQQQRSAA